MIKKGTKVVWKWSSAPLGPRPIRVDPGPFQWEGTVTATRKNECYVLFEGGGHWFRYEELEIVS